LSAAALALVTPFALVACGSDESEETAAPSTSAVTSTVEATSSKETSSVETTTSKAKETSEEAEPTTQTPAETQEPESGQGTDPAAAAGACDAADGNPLAVEEWERFQGGEPGDGATRGAISKLGNGWYEIGKRRSSLRYTPEHT